MHILKVAVLGRADSEVFVVALALPVAVGLSVWNWVVQRKLLVGAPTANPPKGWGPDSEVWLAWATSTL